MSKFSDAPWVVEEGISHVKVVTANGEVVFHDLKSCPKVLEDAALIADAPALLDALELAIEYWQHRQQRYKNRSPIWVQQARALIAKHRGGK